MESWAAWQFALALAATASVLALIIADLHVIERAEQAAWVKRTRQAIRARR